MESFNSLLEQQAKLTAELTWKVCKADTYREIGEWLEKRFALERCDPDVMAYFEDYYWMPKDIFRQFIANLKQGKSPQEIKDETIRS